MSTDQAKPAIAGYRTLSADEIAIINDVKQLGKVIEGHLSIVNSHLSAQRAQAMSDDMTQEKFRIDDAQPTRWVSIARTHFQEGLMALARAVAQPTNF